MHPNMSSLQPSRRVAPARPGDARRTVSIRPFLTAITGLPAALFTGMLLITSLASAQVYKVTDEKNGVTFTDRPQEAGEGTVEKIEIREPNTAPAPTPAPAGTARDPVPMDSEDDEATSAQVSITSPDNESTIAMGPGNFTVSARAEPPLAAGERLILMIDGQAFGAEQSATSWFVEGAMRGPHDLVVRRINARGETLATSEPVRVYVLRPSIIGR